MSDRRGFVFTQNHPAATWTIPNRLGRLPAGIKTIVDGIEWETDEYADMQNIVLTFSSPQKGRAIIT